jgi:hypothetical protein
MDVKICSCQLNSLLASTDLARLGFQVPDYHFAQLVFLLSSTRYLWAPRRLRVSVREGVAAL